MQQAVGFQQSKVCRPVSVRLSNKTNWLPALNSAFDQDSEIGAYRPAAPSETLVTWFGEEKSSAMNLLDGIDYSTQTFLLEMKVTQDQ